MKLILTGDVNLMNVADPTVPFARVAGELRSADMVFSNLECCLFDPGGHSVLHEGFYAHPGPGSDALEAAGIRAVGIANNVNYGEAAIKASIARLDALGIAHTGAGPDLAAARAPAVVKGEVTCGFLQRSSVYWPTNHEAGNAATGIAIIRGHTAYHVPMHKTRPEIPPPNRPGVPPEIVTWADAGYLRAFTDDIAALAARVDIVVASCHWGLGQEVLAYMTQIAHAAIDAGAHIVMGHGPHYSLPVEVYKGRQIFYGLGSFSFHTGHGGRKHGDWLGMMVRAEVERDGLKRAVFQFVRHNERNETVLCALADERTAFEDLKQRSAQMGARLSAQGDEVLVEAAR
jgi:poly-gamma-glutamate capsule biosynthesis protein CapA/YwtB (metallophosphatase superfamily)